MYNNLTLLKYNITSLQIYRLHFIPLHHFYVVKMRAFKLKLIKSNKEIGDEDYTFKLDEKATTLDLKEAFFDEEGYHPDEVRLIYQRQEGFDEPLDDTELLEDIEKHPGVFLLEIQSLKTFDGKIHIRHDKEVDVLVGTLKEFEHYRLTKNSAALKVPWSKGKPIS